MRRGLLLAFLCVGCKEKGAAPTVPPVPLPSAVSSTDPHVDVPPMMALAGTLGADDVRLFVDTKDAQAEAVLLDVSHQVSTRLSGSVDARGHLRIAQPAPGASLDATLGADGSLDGTWDEPKRGTLKVHLAVLKSAPEPAGTRAFVGTLGSSTRIRAKLSRDGAKLGGVYRYSHSKEDLKLAGTLDERTGKFDLDEATGKGDKSGRWSGYVLSPSFFAGMWTSPDGTKRYPVTLSSGMGWAADTYPEIVDLSAGRKLIPQEDYKEPAPFCQATRVWAELAGGAQAKSLNPQLRALAGKDELDAASCKGATADVPFYAEASYAVTAKRPNAVGIQITHTSFTGGAHEAHSLSCVTIDLDKGRVVTIGKLMTAENLDALGKIATAILQKENGVTDLTKAGFFEAAVKVTADTPICLTDSGVDVSFNPYEVAPWSMGAPVVHVGSKEIRPLLPSDVASLVP
jgi:hypothetical protein